MGAIKINSMIYQQVYVDLKDAILAIKQALGFSTCDGFLCIRDGKLQYGRDVSYHGSPCYEYEVVSDNPKWLELYKSIECLDEYVTHSKDPVWNKMLHLDTED